MKNLNKKLKEISRQLQLEAIERFGDSFKSPRSKSWITKKTPQQERKEFRQQREYE
jgi:hypothetical protein